MADQTEMMDKLLKSDPPTPRDMTGAAISPRDMNNTQAQAQMDIQNEIANVIRERTGAAPSQSEIDNILN